MSTVDTLSPSRDFEETFRALAAVPCTADFRNRESISPEELQVGVGCVLSRRAFDDLLEKTSHANISSHGFANYGYCVRDGRIFAWWRNDKEGEHYACRILTPEELEQIPFQFRETTMSHPPKWEFVPQENTPTDIERRQATIARALEGAQAEMDLLLGGGG